MMGCERFGRGGLILGVVLVLGGCGSEVPTATAPEVPTTAAQPQPAVPKPKPAAPPMPGAITEVDLGRLMELRDAGTVLLLDVRPGIVFSIGHIPGAVSLPKKSFDAAWPGRRAEVEAAIAAGKVVVVYCANEDCPDGYAVAKRLSAMGHAVSIYKGGWDEWKMAGVQ